MSQLLATLIVATSVGLLSSCDCASLGASEAGSSVRSTTEVNTHPEEDTWRHQNGLVIELTAGKFQRRDTQLGFLVTPLPLARGISSISVELLSIPPAGENWLRLRDAQVEVCYDVEIYEGASGGPQRQLQAWRKIESGVIFVRQSRQDGKQGLDGFELALSIVTTAR